MIEVVIREATLEIGAGVDPWRSMTLEVDVVAWRATVFPAEEMIEADLVQRGGTGEGRQVAANPVGVLVGLDHHHRCVPPDERPDAALDVLVAWKPRLVFARNRVDVRGTDRGREAHLAGARPVEQLR